MACVTSARCCPDGQRVRWGGCVRVRMATAPSAAAATTPTPAPARALRRCGAKEVARAVLCAGVHDSIAIYRRSFDDASSLLVLGSIDGGMGSRHRGGQALSRSVELGVSADLGR